MFKHWKQDENLKDNNKIMLCRIVQVHWINLEKAKIIMLSNFKQIKYTNMMYNYLKQQVSM